MRALWTVLVVGLVSAYLVPGLGSTAPQPVAPPVATATATAQPTATATAAPSLGPAEVAAHLAERAPSPMLLSAPPRPFAIGARALACRRACAVSAVLRPAGGRRATLARGSSRARAGAVPVAVLRFTPAGRRLGRGRHAARVTITVRQDGRVARRSRALVLRVSG